MASQSTIEWTDKTWNPVTGCTRISPGCQHCYAERMSARLANMARSQASPGRKVHHLRVVKGWNWNNKIDLVPEALGERRILERACAVNLTVDASEPALPPKSRDGGACFGDPETNRRVERAAVRFVSEWYRRRGWKVKTVEATKCGYDLICRKAGKVEHVEVKGITGDKQCFNITASEVTQAENNSAFILCIVTSALSQLPSMSRLTGAQLRDRFKFRPLQFHAMPISDTRK